MGTDTRKSCCFLYFIRKSFKGGNNTHCKLPSKAIMIIFCQTEWLNMTNLAESAIYQYLQNAYCMDLAHFQPYKPSGIHLDIPIESQFINCCRYLSSEEHIVHIRIVQHSFMQSDSITYYRTVASSDEHS